MNQNFNNKKTNFFLFKKYQKHVNNNLCFDYDKSEHMFKNCHFKSKNKLIQNKTSTLKYTQINIEEIIKKLK